MAAKRVLIITNEVVANPASVPEVVANQVTEADAVCVVAPALTGKLHSWVSDIDAEFREADERMRMLVSGIDSSGPAVSGRVGDEDPLQAVADALVEFPADALILGVHASDDAKLARTTLQQEGTRAFRPACHRGDARSRRAGSLGHERVASF